MSIKLDEKVSKSDDHASIKDPLKSMSDDQKHEKSDDEVVISGFSGRLPESSTMEEFKENLFNGIDMVNDDPRRWPKGLYGLSTRLGKFKHTDLEIFDEQFFNIRENQADFMDPVLRMLMEITHEAIIDAGYNPQELRGSRTGVYIGISYAAGQQYWTTNVDHLNANAFVGCAMSLWSGRISFTFDFVGPSCALDTACSSSLFAMSKAFNDMKSDRCDAAIVAGAGLIFRPTISLQAKRMGMLNDEGKCKSFDANANGFVRTDACVAIFLQKSSVARRCYSTVLNVRTNTDGYKQKGLIFPSGNQQNRLIRDAYDEIGLNPAEVKYVELHGTGTKAGDSQEVNAVTDLFCVEQRDAPLLIGSVKSNMGHGEAASGLCSIIKVILAMESGVIPANLHFSKPNPDLYGVIDGRVKVVERNTPLAGDIVGVNSFGFGGANVHVILKSNAKLKSQIILNENAIPRLVVVSGRTTQAIDSLLDAIEENRSDDEFLGLVNEIHARNIPLHLYRGYAVVGETETIRECNEVDDANRPIWYIYSGLGSQWASMAADLMRLDVFRQSIDRCADAVRPYGIDLVDILTRSDEVAFDQILHSFVAIVATQIGLTDVLTHLSVSPSRMVGHSVGELGCAYADGCLTVEQTILAAYWRGRSIADANIEEGAMASIGLSLEETKARLPANTVVACHNSINNVTVSGPSESISGFVRQLTQEGIFAKIVRSSGYALHSQYIADAGPKFHKSLEKLIPTPASRTSRWLSTSIPESNWSTSIAQQCSAAYLVNNLLSPVLFNETIRKIPKNAICIEIAPSGLMQPILKRALSKEAINLSLMKRGHQNNLAFFMSSIGKLYSAGAQPVVSKLYAPISYPVSRGTPMLNSRIGWNHSKRYFVPKLGKDETRGETVVEVNVTKSEDTYLTGHRIDGRVSYPASGYLILAWCTFAKHRNSTIQETPIVFKDILFHRYVHLPSDGSAVKLGVKFLDGTDQFTICKGDALAVSGRISVSKSIESEELELHPLKPDTTELPLQSNDIYKEFRLRGCDFSGKFRGIFESDYKFATGKLLWQNDWVSFIDAMMQFNELSGHHSRDLHLPARIDRIVLNPQRHQEIIDDLKQSVSIIDTVPAVPVHVYKNANVVKAGGIEIRGLKASLIASHGDSKSAPPILERYVFVPLLNGNETLSTTPEWTRLHAISVAIHFTIENGVESGATTVKVADVVENKMVNDSLAQIIQWIIESEPSLVSDVTIFTNQPNESYVEAVSGSRIHVDSRDLSSELIEVNTYHLVVAYDVVERPNAQSILTNLQSSIQEGGFVLLEETIVDFDEVRANRLFAASHLMIACVQRSTTKKYILLRRTVNVSTRNKTIVWITENNFGWLEQLKSTLATAEVEQRYVYVVGQGEECLGAVGLMKCIRNEVGGKYARLVFVPDANVEKFSFASEMYANQLKADLISNVYKNGCWGTYRHLKLDELDGNGLKATTKHVHLEELKCGVHSSLSWIQSQPSIKATKGDMELCTVHYAPINFRDVQMSAGQIQGRSFGLEFTGRDSNGRRVMALVQGKSLATTCVARRKLIWEIPSTWTMEQASTIPYAYSIAYYALIVRGQLKKGESILIHNGCESVGLAAINVALHYGASIFTTVDSAEKREILKNTFIQLTDAHIANSNDTSFEPFILDATNGCGLKLVLNPFDGDKLQASMRCLGKRNGRFLQIGEFNLQNANALVCLKNASFHCIAWDDIVDGDAKTIDVISKLVTNGIETGVVRPPPSIVFDAQQVEHAFDYFESGKHIGKVVIKLRDEEQITAAKLVRVIPRTYLLSEKSYVIVGGLGGFGLELADWLVSRGATKVVLVSRSGIKTAYQSMMVRRWTERGNAEVLIDTNDVTTSNGVRNLLTVANKLAPVGGIFNLAAVLRDARLENQTEADFEMVLAPKVDATKHLDLVSRELCPVLDYFVCFSSISSGRGNVGQSNYGLANSAMERICEQRQLIGLPGTAIQWGSIGDTGMIIDTGLGDNDSIIGGTLPQRMRSCMQTMDVFMQQPYAVLASMVVADKCQRSDRSNAIGGDASLTSCVENILGLKDLKNVSDQATLSDLGMDSLMGTEVRQILEKDFGIVLSAHEIRNLSFQKLRILEFGEGDANTTSALLGQAHKTLELAAMINDDAIRTVFSGGLMPTECFVQLNTRTPPSDGNRLRPIFAVHSIEGFATPMKPLAAKLTAPVYGLQCSAEAPLNSMTQLAEFYIRQMKRVQQTGPYVIVGYSFGASVAFEMGTLLEDAGERVTLVMIDGSPEYLSWIIEFFQQDAENDNNGNESASQDTMIALSFLVNVFDISKKFRNAQLMSDLEGIATLDLKLKRIAELIAQQTVLTVDAVHLAAQSFSKKILASLEYNPKRKLSAASNVVLFKTTDNNEHLSADYGLSEIVTNRVEVATIEGKHRTLFAMKESVNKMARVLDALCQ